MSGGRDGRSNCCLCTTLSSSETFQASVPLSHHRRRCGECIIEMAPIHQPRACCYHEPRLRTAAEETGQPCNRLLPLNRGCHKADCTDAYQYFLCRYNGTGSLEAASRSCVAFITVVSEPGNTTGLRGTDRRRTLISAFRRHWHSRRGYDHRLSPSAYTRHFRGNLWARA